MDQVGSFLFEAVTDNVRRTPEIDEGLQAASLASVMVGFQDEAEGKNATAAAIPGSQRLARHCSRTL